MMAWLATMVVSTKDLFIDKENALGPSMLQVCGLAVMKFLNFPNNIFFAAPRTSKLLYFKSRILEHG